MLDNQLKKVESIRDDLNLYYQVLRGIKCKKPKPLNIKDKNNIMLGWAL